LVGILPITEDDLDLEREQHVRLLLEQPDVLFNRHRFAIMLELYHVGGVDFSQLMHDLNLSEGALATHLKALERDRLLNTKKESTGTRSRVISHITKAGMVAVENMYAALSLAKDRVGMYE